MRTDSEGSVPQYAHVLLISVVYSWNVISTGIYFTIREKLSQYSVTYMRLGVSKQIFPGICGVDFQKIPGNIQGIQFWRKRADVCCHTRDDVPVRLRQLSRFKFSSLSSFESSEMSPDHTSHLETTYDRRVLPHARRTGEVCVGEIQLQKLVKFWKCRNVTLSCTTLRDS